MIIFSAWENVFCNFKSRFFSIEKLDQTSTPELTPQLATEPTKHKKSKLKLRQELMNEIIVD